MKYHNKNSLFDNRNAVLGQPFYLLVIIIVAASIIVVLICSLQQIMINSEIYHVEHEINRIETEATNMFEYANDGTTITLHLSFPTSLRHIVFGALPTNTTTDPSLLTLDENTSNNYYFEMNNGIVQTYHSNARFCDKNLTRIVVLHPGEYTLTLELCSYEEKTYVKIY
jgi:hypothetical protein